MDGEYCTCQTSGQMALGGPVTPRQEVTTFERNELQQEGIMRRACLSENESMKGLANKMPAKITILRTIETYRLLSHCILTCKWFTSLSFRDYEQELGHTKEYCLQAFHKGSSSLPIYSNDPLATLPSEPRHRPPFDMTLLVCREPFKTPPISSYIMCNSLTNLDPSSRICIA